jgi:3-hydroxyisobutyrate dehydrogenase
MIAFLGTGLLGAGFVRAALGRGESVSVWNRTAAKAAVFAADGARVATTPADAVRGATRVHLVLLDDAAVDSVIAQLLSALEPGAVIIDHSTTAPKPTAERATRLAEQGIAFVHAPVFMGPSNAENATGLILVSAPKGLFEQIEPALSKMTGKVRYMGERSDLAAAYKLFGNLTVMFVIGGLADMFALGRSVGVDPREAYTLFEDFNPAGQFTGRGRRMADGDFEPTFELTAARKDIRLMEETAAAGGVTLHMLPHIARRMEDVIAAGHGADDLASLGAADVAADVA